MRGPMNVNLCVCVCVCVCVCCFELAFILFYVTDLL